MERRNPTSLATDVKDPMTRKREILFSPNCELFCNRLYSGQSSKKEQEEREMQNLICNGCENPIDIDKQDFIVVNRHKAGHLQPHEREYFHDDDCMTGYDN